MRFAIAQLDLTVAAFASNLARITAAVARARAEHADLLLLPELATLGYPPRDLLERRDVVDANLRQLERIAALSDERLGILVGFVEPNPGATGRSLFNAAALCHRGAVAGVARKSLLPTYDVFDEDRHFEPAAEVAPLAFRGLRLGVTICEDVWTDPDLLPGRRYRREPAAELVAAGADVLLNLSASPFSMGKAAVRRELFGREAARHRRYLLMVNQVGGNDELVFDGHSLVLSPSGALVARAHDFREDFLLVDIPDADLGAGGESVAAGPVRPVCASADEEALAALVLGLASYAGKSGFGSAVLGLSGGVDSALTAAVAARALGPENVLGVAMPTRYSSPASLADAAALAANLGARFLTVPIDELYQCYLDRLHPLWPDAPFGTTEENLQARIRGNVIMALSNRFGHLPLATGNKSELAVGYSTLYGDMAGGLAVIGDVPKTLVYRLAELVNRDGEVIPRRTLTRPPSAELRPDQTDQDSLPPYELLDRVLAAYVERNWSVAEMVAGGLDPAVVRRVVAMVDRAEHKRRQAAPVLKITGKAFGPGRRYPIAAGYADLHVHTSTQG